MAVTPVVVALTAGGAAIGRRAADALGAPLHGRVGRVAEADLHFAETTAHLRELFAAGVPILQRLAPSLQFFALLLVHAAVCERRRSRATNKTKPVRAILAVSGSS